LSDPRFYTLPPRGVEYPYLFVTFSQRRELLRRRHEHAIMDSNVGLFFLHMGLRDYPPSFLRLHYPHAAKVYSELLRGRLLVTIPDYPSDYFIGGRQAPSAEDNVERTLRNIREFLKVSGVNWLPVIQSRFMDTLSFIDSCERVKELVGHDYPQVAIGTVCKSRDLRWIAYCCRYARLSFPRSWIHAFGLTLGALPHVRKYIDSWDSTAYTFPRPRGHSCKNSAEARKYFEDYLSRMKLLLSD
jgi:hypothetical protein